MSITCDIAGGEARRMGDRGPGARGDIVHAQDSAVVGVGGVQSAVQQRRSAVVAGGYRGAGKLHPTAVRSVVSIKSGPEMGLAVQMAGLGILDDAGQGFGAGTEDLINGVHTLE